MGHCVESGYALVTDAGELHPLDTAATPQVIAALKRSSSERGLRLRAERELADGEMKTARIQEL